MKGGKVPGEVPLYIPQSDKVREKAKATGIEEDSTLVALAPVLGDDVIGKNRFAIGREEIGREPKTDAGRDALMA